MFCDYYFAYVALGFVVDDVVGSLVADLLWLPPIELVIGLLVDCFELLGWLEHYGIGYSVKQRVFRLIAQILQLCDQIIYLWRLIVQILRTSVIIHRWVLQIVECVDWFRYIENML